MKRNRILSISAALLLAMALLTVQALAADDWICPQCGKRVREIVGDICPYCGYERHVHDWLPATCVSPKTCRTCGETEGEPLPAEMTNPYAIVENVDMTDTVLNGVNILEHYKRTEPLMA